MNQITESLLKAIDEAQARQPKWRDYPKLVGSVIALETGDSETLAEWISLLEDKNTLLCELLAIVAKWDTSTEESIAYYVEITDQLKDGLSIAIDAVGY